MPDSDSQCGPYDVQFNPSIHGNKVKWGPGHHDTIGIIAQDSQGNIAAATSTNGARSVSYTHLTLPTICSV